jgi:2-hydroxychromene-2-carboxylate isomerase
MRAREPQFFYDFSSPYSYLAATRVDDVLPVRPMWRPITFGVIVQRIGKVPWSFAENRHADLVEIDRRAIQHRLPPLRYPRGWPRETYSLTPLRAALVADDAGLLREVSRELFRAMFVDGRHFADLDTTLDAAERAGMDREEIRAGIQRQDIKDRLRASTEEALARGVTGVPTVAVGDELFWGDDQLEAAAAATQRRTASLIPPGRDPR